MKNLPSILGGLIGSIIGFVCTMILLELVGFGNRNDPITSGFIALLISAGGAVGGLLVGTTMVRSFSGVEVPGSAAGINLKALGVLVALVVAGGTGYLVYSLATATPWLKPAGTVLRYEVRLPPGSTAETVKGVKIDLETSQNSMPFSYHRDTKVIGDNPPVVAGVVDLAFRTAYRQLDLKIPGQPVRSFSLKIPASPPHSQFSDWQKHPDGGEIRYRVVWPGQD